MMRMVTVRATKLYNICGELSLSDGLEIISSSCPDRVVAVFSAHTIRRGNPKLSCDTGSELVTTVLG